MKKGGTHARWTAEEDAIVREHGTEHGPAWKGWADLLPSRSASAVRSRMATLGVRVRRAGGGTIVAASPQEAATRGEWTNEERETLVSGLLIVTKACGHSLRECLDETASLVAAYRAGELAC